MVEEGGSSFAGAASFRLYNITGRRAGKGTLQATDIDRLGPGKSLDQADLTVAADTPDTDMTYTGKWLVWSRSLPSSLIPAGPHLFAATSGLIGHQVAREQRSKDHGPLPEGTYRFTAAIDPRQSSVQTANALGDDAAANAREGIQFLRIGGNGPVDVNWGTMRVRLTPTQGDMFGRSGFYLPNSHKGFSHGCVEVGPSLDGIDFFTALQSYVGEPGHRGELSVRVKYGFQEQTTVGRTFRPS